MDRVVHAVVLFSISVWSESLMSRSVRSRAAAGLGTLALATAAFGFSASAHAQETAPSDSAELCEAAGGEFASVVDGDTTTTTCTVTTTENQRFVRLPGWFIEVEDTFETVYTTETVRTRVPGEALACINPGGNVVGGWDPATPESGNPNCAAALAGMESRFSIQYAEDTWTEDVTRSVEGPTFVSRETIRCVDPNANNVDPTSPACQVPYTP